MSSKKLEESSIKLSKLLLLLNDDISLSYTERARIYNLTKLVKKKLRILEVKYNVKSVTPPLMAN